MDMHHHIANLEAAMVHDQAKGQVKRKDSWGRRKSSESKESKKVKEMKKSLQKMVDEVEAQT